MTTLQIRGGTVVTGGDEPRVLPDHDVLIEGNRITGIAPTGTLAAADARVLDARGKLVLPGFINAHTHFYSTLVRGASGFAPAHSFTEVLENLWWRLDRALTEADIRASAQVALVDAVRQGTTTLLDHHASPRAAAGSLGVLAEVVASIGLRASLCYEVSDRDGPEIAAAGLAENATFAAHCRGSSGDTLRALFGLHASFTLSDATVSRAAELAATHEIGMHIHVAEATSDQEHCLARHRCRVVERLDRLGVLGPRTIAAHCVHVDRREMTLLADSATAVAHCPQSNMNNAVGIANLLGLREHGVLIGLGTDAMTNCMLEELRAALWACRLSNGDPSVGFVEACSLLLDGNRQIAGRYWPNLGVGELHPGAAADVVLVDYQPPTPLDESTLLGHLVFGLSQAIVDSTICGGRVLMAGKRLELDIDEAELAAEARARARELWARL